MKDFKIRVGIVGASSVKGWALISHIPALTKLPVYELTAVSTTNIVSATESKKKFGAKFGFDNHEELVRHPDVDLVVIAVKTPDHFNIVKLALENNKHIYCEWPLGNGLAETQELVRLAQSRNVICAIGLQGRYSPSINQIRDLIQNNTIGRVLSATMIASAGEVFGGTIAAADAYMCESQNGATMLTIQFGHFVDYFCYVLGEFSSLNSTILTQNNKAIVNETGVEIDCRSPDQIIVNGIIAKDIAAVIHIRGGQPKVNNFMWEIHGTEGDVLISLDAGYLHMNELSILLSQKGNRDLIKIDIDDSFKIVEFEDPNVPAYSLSHLYKALAKDIENNKQTVPSFRDALSRYKLIEKVKLAAETGECQLFNAE